MIAVKLNNHSDADILARLETLRNKQGHIRQALQADMAQDETQQ